MNEIWVPSEDDFISSSRSYLDYATGLTMLTNTAEMADFLGYDDLSGENLKDYVISAEAMMLSGLRGVISYANEPELRSKLLSMETTFDQANPIQLAAQEYAFYKFGEQIDQINDRLKILKPLPVSDRVIYGYLCHSRLVKIPTKRLIQPFRNSDVLDEILVGRTLADARNN